MGEAHNAADYRNELDQMLANVMPKSWPGHARIAAYKKTRHMSDASVGYAVTFAERLSERTGASPEAVADKALEVTKEKEV